VAAPAPLFTALLNYRHTRLIAGARRGEAWEGVRLVHGEERTSYPLTVNVDDLGADFEIAVQSVPGMVAGRVAAQFATALEALVEALAVEPARAACALPVLPEPERRQLLVDFNAGAAADADVVLVHRLFEQRAAENPAAIALVFDDEVLTYAELDARAERLAGALAACGLAPDDRVAICLERSPAEGARGRSAPGGSLGEHGDGIASAHRDGQLGDGSRQRPQACPVDEQRARGSRQPADERPLSDLTLGHQPHRRQGGEREDVDPGQVVGDDEDAPPVPASSRHP